jgi:hypothetical protein
MESEGGLPNDRDCQGYQYQRDGGGAFFLRLTRRASKYKSSQNNERRFSTSSGMTFDFPPFRSNSIIRKELESKKKKHTKTDLKEKKAIS